MSIFPLPQYQCVFHGHWGAKRSYWTAPGISPELTPDLLLHRVYYVTGISVSDMKSKCRKREIVTARQVFFYLARETFPKMGLKTLGAMLDKDHATVIHSSKAVKDLIEAKDKTILEILKKLENIN